MAIICGLCSLQAWLARNPRCGAAAAANARLAPATFEKILELLEWISGAVGGEAWGCLAQLSVAHMTRLNCGPRCAGHGYALSAADAVAQIPARLEAIKDPQGNPRFQLPSGLPPGRIIGVFRVAQLVTAPITYIVITLIQRTSTSGGWISAAS